MEAEKKECNRDEEMTFLSVFDEKGESFQTIMEKILLNKIVNKT